MFDKIKGNSKKIATLMKAKKKVCTNAVEAILADARASPRYSKARASDSKEIENEGLSLTEYSMKYCNGGLNSSR